jgi:hypothetical protein
MILLNMAYNSFKDMPIQFVYVIAIIFVIFLITLPIKIWYRRKPKNWRR